MRRRKSERYTLFHLIRDIVLFPFLVLIWIIEWLTGNS